MSQANDRGVEARHAARNVQQVPPDRVGLQTRAEHLPRLVQRQQRVEAALEALVQMRALYDRGKLGGQKLQQVDVVFVKA